MEIKTLIDFVYYKNKYINGYIWIGTTYIFYRICISKSIMLKENRLLGAFFLVHNSKNKGCLKHPFEWQLNHCTINKLVYL